MGKISGSLHTTPIKSYVGGMSKWRDGWIDEVPRGRLSPRLALLANAHPAVGHLLDQLGQILQAAGVGSNELTRAGLEGRRVPHKHNIPSGGPHHLQQQLRQVHHPLVELKVGFVGLQVLEGNLGLVGGVNLQTKLGQFGWGHEGRGKTPLTPSEPLEHAVLNPDLQAGLLQTLQDGVCCLHAAQGWGTEDVRQAYPLLPHALPRELGLVHAHLRYGGVLGKVVRSTLPLRYVPWHVKVPACVEPVGVKRQRYPLLPEGDVHPLRVTADKESSWTICGKWGSLPSFLACVRADARFVFALLVDLGIEAFYIVPIGEEPGSPHVERVPVFTRGGRVTYLALGH